MTRPPLARGGAPRRRRPRRLRRVAAVRAAVLLGGDARRRPRTCSAQGAHPAAGRRARSSGPEEVDALLRTGIRGNPLRARGARDRGVGSRGAPPRHRPRRAAGRAARGRRRAARIPLRRGARHPGRPSAGHAAALGRATRSGTATAGSRSRSCPAGMPCRSLPRARRAGRQRHPAHGGRQRRLRVAASTRQRSARSTTPGCSTSSSRSRPMSWWATRGSARSCARPSAWTRPCTMRAAARQLVELDGPQVWNLKVHRVGGLDGGVPHRTGSRVRRRVALGRDDAGVRPRLPGRARRRERCPGFVYPSDVEPSARWFGPGRGRDRAHDGHGRDDERAGAFGATFAGSRSLRCRVAAD